jgi:hypothetical protein
MITIVTEPRLKATPARDWHPRRGSNHSTTWIRGDTMGSSRQRNSSSAKRARSVQKSSKRGSKLTKLRKDANALRVLEHAQAPKGKKETKKRKKVKRVEKSVPDFDDIHNAILDSYALIYLGHQTILERTDGGDEKCSHAIVVVDHGVKLLKEAADRFEKANSRLGSFCLQNHIEQEHLQDAGAS